MDEEGNRRSPTGATIGATEDDYDAEADFARSIMECYRFVRARVAAGGPGWGGWPRDQARHDPAPLLGGIERHPDAAARARSGADPRSLACGNAAKSEGVEMKYPWMPLFNGDLLANTLHLSAQEFGAYMLLIIHAWEFSAKVKVADAQRIARVGNRHWAKVRATLAPFFDPPDGLQGGALEVVHTRVSTELAIAAEMSNKRKSAAEQMHANRRARAEQVHTQLPSLHSNNSSNGKVGDAPSVQVHANFRDPGVEYRSPPRAKSDNVLQPLPEKQVAGKV